ncbi:hypothetical protein [Chryseobacterium daeguense]|nr:hypothetical protein [Chryseobacterium daeguense]
MNQKTTDGCATQYRFSEKNAAGSFPEPADKMGTLHYSSSCNAE